MDVNIITIIIYLHTFKLHNDNLFVIARLNSGNYETCRTDRASALSQLRLGYTSTTPWIRSPASIVARHAITLIVRLGT